MIPPRGDQNLKKTMADVALVGYWRRSLRRCVWSRNRKRLSQFEMKPGLGGQDDIFLASEGGARSTRTTAGQRADRRALSAAGHRSKDRAESRAAARSYRSSLPSVFADVFDFVGLHGIARSIDADRIDHELK